MNFSGGQVKPDIQKGVDTLKLSKKYGGLQFFAPPKAIVNVNGEDYSLSYNDAAPDYTWGGNANEVGNSDYYTISGNNVVWNNGEILQSNGVDVLPTDNFTNVSPKPVYTTRAAGGGTVSETWLLNDIFNFENSQWITLSASFTSNGQSFSSIKYHYAPTANMYINYDSTWVYDNDDHSGWANEAYRTIVLDTPATGALLTWLQANATKQANPRVSVDLATAFPDKWAALSIGKHTLQIRAKNPGNYLDSDLSTAIEFYKTCSITTTATHCTAAASNPTTFPDVGGGDTILTFNKVTGYTLPETIVITGVAGLGTGYIWTVASDGQSAQLKILKALGDITVKVEGVVETYSITTNLTHATKESGPSTIAYGASATLVFAFPTGYEAPTDVTVTGATKSWTAGTATLVLSNPTGPVTVTLVGVATTTTLDGGTYKWHDSINLGEWTQNLNFTSNGTSYTGMQYTGDGTAMTLQYRYGGSEWVTVYNYNEDTSTGSWVNDNYKIVDLGTSAQTVTAIFKADFIANTTKLTQLATPQNVTADGTNVSWDEVENATSYEVVEGGNNVLGTVKTSFVLSARNTESLVDLKYKKDGTVTSSDYDGILEYSETRTNIEGIKSYITFGAFGTGDTMSISNISGMVNCTAEQVSDEVVKLTLTGDATATLTPSD